MEAKNMKSKLTTLGISLLLISTVLVGLMGAASAVAPPVPARPTGPAQGSMETLYTFTVPPVLTIPHFNVSYRFDFGDGFNTGWLGPYTSAWDDPIEAQHSYHANGPYQVKVQTKNMTSSEESAYSLPHNITIGGAQGPLFGIESVKGGFGVTATIVNNLAPSKYVDYTFEVSGGQLTMFHTHKWSNGTLWVESGKSNSTALSQFFGLGKIKISVTAYCADEKVASANYSAFLLFVYVMNVQQL
jgi:hypothetical protein